MYEVVTLLQLDVARLKKSPGDFARYELLAELPPLELSGERFNFSGPVNASLVVHNNGSTLSVGGMVSGGLRLTCCRCLETFDFLFEVPIEETYSQTAGRGREEEVPFSGDVIDATPEVLKSIILALPMKAVCRDRCPGLCPKCGHNLNEGACDCAGEDIDPRLSVLKELLKDKQSI